MYEHPVHRQGWSSERRGSGAPSGSPAAINHVKSGARGSISAPVSREGRRKSPGRGFAFYTAVTHISSAISIP